MRTPPVQTRALTAGVVALLLVATAGCGGKAAPDASASGPAAAAVAADGLNKTQLVDAMVAAVQKQTSVHLDLRMTSSDARMSATGDVRYGTADPALAMTVKAPMMGAGTVEVRGVDGLLYVSMPPMTPPGKFVKIDPAKVRDRFGSGMKGMSGQADPRRVVSMLEKGLDRVSYRGTETVGGEQLSHYVLTVNTAAGRRLMRGHLAGGHMMGGGQLGMPFSGRTTALPRYVSYDVWLDADNLVRRVRGGAAGMRIAVTLSDWGTNVDVQAPPASDVVQMPAL